MSLYDAIHEDKGSVPTGAALGRVARLTSAFDSYCPQCGQDSVFHMIKHASVEDFPYRAEHDVSQVSADMWIRRVGVHMVKSAVCQRDRAHLMQFVLATIREDATYRVIKIGQFPSAADIVTGDFKKFSPILDKEAMRQLNKGIGLHAHGVGIGAHIYLRRVFEHLIEDAHQAVLKDANAGWDESKYTGLRMSERIRALAAHLPDFLVRHPKLYGILSKQVHEISEDDCKRNFEPLLRAIEVVLDEKLAVRERAKRQEAALASLERLG